MQQDNTTVVQDEGKNLALLNAKTIEIIAKSEGFAGRGSQQTHIDYLLGLDKGYFIIEEDSETNQTKEVEEENVTPESSKIPDELDLQDQEKEITKRTEVYKKWLGNRTEEQLQEIKVTLDNGTFIAPEKTNSEEVMEFTKDFFKKWNAEKAEKAEKKEKNGKEVTIKIKLIVDVLYGDKKLKRGEILNLDEVELKKFGSSFYELV